jgi:hypothetical protein
MGTHMQKIALALTMVALTGCTTEMIYMRNMNNGETAICGGHPAIFPAYAAEAASHDKECVKEYERQGYVRAPSPY